MTDATVVARQWLSELSAVPPRGEGITWVKGHDGLGTYAEAYDRDGIRVAIHGPCLRPDVVDAFIAMVDVA